MKSYQVFILIGSLCLLTSFGCSKSDDLAPREEPPANELQFIYPGEEIPSGIKVMIAQSGKYLIPGGASSIHTRCFGTVTLSFELADSSPQSNTCQSDSGSSSQTNLISGVDELSFSMGLGSYAEVLLK